MVGGKILISGITRSGRMRSISGAEISRKRVLLRADFNVPMQNGKIVDNFRIKRSLPTIELLLKNKNKIIVITHLGKPAGKVVSEISTLPLASELAKLLKRKVFATNDLIAPNIDQKIKDMKEGDILVLGNLRFDPGEEQNSEEFAKCLATLGEVFVNDAFGSCHRAHASTDAITKYLPCYAGILIELEIATLSLLLKNPISPFVLVMGGAKVKDKTGLITNLAKFADKILIGGAIANTFFASTGQNIGQSLYEPEMMSVCREMLQKFRDKIVLPVDFIREDTESGDFKFLDIGVNSRAKFKEELSRANTVFWNGNMGYSEDGRFRSGTDEIARAIAENRGTTVVSGGDTVGYINSNNLSEGISFISTGGGATLHFLSNEDLPGIKALNRISGI